MKKDICGILGIKYPIFQGGMAWVSESTLAAAVSNAGGLGIIAGANAPASHIRDEIRKTKKLTDKPFGLNIMLLSDNADELADIAIEEGVKVITTGAGNPGKYIDKWKNAGIVVIPVVASVALAKRMERSRSSPIIGSVMLLTIASIYFLAWIMSANVLFLYSVKRSAIRLNEEATSANSWLSPKSSLFS